MFVPTHNVHGSLETIRDYKIKSNWFLLTFKIGLLGIRRKSTQKTRCHRWSTTGKSWEKVSI
uniref:Uncharacterized protein n=1 Tax=Medicago truncatula TaxID=3880 RepID=I3SH40_MEDTR|nr:unknown [Medicago truncatula]